MKYFFEDGTLQGVIDLQIFRCLDMEAQGFEKVPKSGCREAIEVFDMEEWGGYLDATFTRHDGVICTDPHTASNKPSGRYDMYTVKTVFRM